MVRTKKTVNVDTPDLIINQGSHLTTCLNSSTGEFKMTWDWNTLLEEVQTAIAAVSTDIVEVTEAKVKKTRAKKQTS